MKINKRQVGNKFEDFIIRWKMVICIFFSIIITILYYFKIVSNIRENLGNIVALLAAMLVVVTLILTLLLYLNDKEKYKDAIAEYGEKNGKNMVYQYVYRIIIANILCIIIAIMIGIVQTEAIIIKLIISLVGSCSFCYLMMGSIYMLYFSIDIVSGINKEKGKKVK